MFELTYVPILAAEGDGAMGPGTAILVLVAIVVLAAIGKGVKIIRPYEKGVIEFLGKYKRTTESGLTIIVPFFETLAKVDMREQVVDVPPQEVITKDNVVVTVDAVVYYEATDPVKLRYNVADFYSAATKLAQTNLRNVIGDMALDESLTSRDVINTQLRTVLDDATDKWGVRVVRVEMQRIEPPHDVTQAMHRQMKAERERRATILEAEGEKQSQIERATGERQSRILRAEGEAQAIETVANAQKYRKIAIAEGEATAIHSVYDAINESNPTNELIALQYLKSLEAIANGKANKVFLPLDASGLMGSVAAIADLIGKGSPVTIDGDAAKPPPPRRAR